MKIKNLKVRPDSPALAFQAKIPKALSGRALMLGLKNPVVMSLGLDGNTASEAQIVAAIERKREKFQSLLRFLSNTDIDAVAKQDLETSAELWVNQQGYQRGALYGIEKFSEPWVEALDHTLGLHFNQDHPEWAKTYPKLQKLPKEFISAIQAILETREHDDTHYVFTYAINAYKDHRKKEIHRAAQSDAELNRKLYEFKKDEKRLEHFLDYTGNQEFTTAQCSRELKRYKLHLLDQYENPVTAKRHLTVPCAALRWFSNEVAVDVVIPSSIKIDGQQRAGAIRKVLDVEAQLPLIWKAAHDPAYDHFFRLAVFGLFSGSTASELVQTEVEDVKTDKGYVVMGGTKRPHRCRPAVIVNDTHLQLLTHFKAGSIVGPKRVNQTSANHSKILKTHLAQITGDKELDPYSLRHTGKHLADIKGVGESQYVKIMFGWKNKKRDDADKYAAAGHFAAPLIKELRAITALMLEDLPDYDNNPDLLHQTNVVPLRR